MRTFFFIPAVLFFLNADAQWNANPSINNAVCNFSGNQINVQLVADGTGGTIAVWEDNRNGSTDIYAQRLSATGNLLWAVEGIPICTATFNQLNPKIVTDGASGAVISWIDDRNGAGAGSYDIYAQRINASGIVQWVTDGLPVCTATGTQNNQQMLADNSGAMIVWSDGRGGSANADIYAQRLDQVGTPLWTIDGTTVCTASSLQNMPQIISDGGAGSAIIAWEDWRNFSQSDIYAQRISNGFTDWTFNGVLICSESNLAHQYNTRMVADGAGGAIMCWEDKRNSGSNTDLYAQRINNSGTTQWTSNGISICNVNGIQFSHQLIADASGGAIIVWEDRRTNRDIYSQKINATGVIQWALNGIPVCNNFDTQEDPQLVATISGGAIFIWTDSRNSFQQDIYAQSFNAAGVVQWPNNGVPIANEGHAQFSAKLISYGTDEAIIAWTDLRTTLDYDIYSSRLFANGTLPLSLLAFEATVNNNNVTLLWKTGNEINTDYFDVEFSSNGVSFEKLGTVKTNNLPGKNQYHFLHPNPTDNILYYRLKQVDHDGKYKYSNIITLHNRHNQLQTIIAPNPVKDILHITEPAAVYVGSIEIFNSAGTLVMHKNFNINLKVYSLPATLFSAGTYVIRINYKDKSRSFKFIKE
ncbi:MAG: T9SS type A sorting domain-containing protein [Chitinophagaceae bacterium]|nr:T9SS type A sorting domain-containing protein [Chitinophagaceae bacterium]MBK8606077.1 T9SS type A sorting domain-containing protein [Chitinophagaceae bacterium]MBP6476917.1 T9SS type A sorting domain-containing protein [Chitinophagaceae bacterium]MBP7106984.1 T9SS type A sorting domain-containing protein [Chitinophagaceae bacterium]MBP7314161.1 T9SS type A sorting domain-containing protein [Chitinophagaceae bacterium]